MDDRDEPEGSLYDKIATCRAVNQTQRLHLQIAAHKPRFVRRQWKGDVSCRSSASATAQSMEERLGRLATGAANLFPLWLVLGATSAMLHPPSLAWFHKDYTTRGLALTMLAMGTTLTVEVRVCL